MTFKIPKSAAFYRIAHEKGLSDLDKRSEACSPLHSDEWKGGRKRLRPSSCLTKMPIIFEFSALICCESAA